MKLGLKRNEVRLVSHDSAWSKAYEQVKSEIIKETDVGACQIEHVGSTAVKGIIAKPIIDIVVGVESIDNNLTQLEKELRSCGFYRLRVERPNEIVFARFKGKSFEVKTHYIHLTNYQGELLLFVVQLFYEGMMLQISLHCPGPSVCHKYFRESGFFIQL